MAQNATDNNPYGINSLTQASSGAATALPWFGIDRDIPSGGMDVAVNPGDSTSSGVVTTSWQQAILTKKEIAKIKKATPKQVAKAIAKQTKQQVIGLKQRTQMLDADLVNTEQRLERQTRNLAKNRLRIGYYKQRQASLEKDEKTLTKEFEQAIIALKQDERITDITIDDRNRIIATTACLLVKKEDWEAARLAGLYQIRIDFSKNSIRSGVRVLNITQRMDDHYDSPTISNTYCCWGNIEQDIRTDFQTGDVTELVQDMLAYIISPNDWNGYLGMDGESGKGWEKFFEEATGMEDGFSWEQYDQDHEAQEENDAPPQGEYYRESLPEEVTRPETDRPQASFENAFREANNRLRATEQELAQLRRQQQEIRPETPNEYQLYLALQWLGLSRTTLEYAFVHLRTSNIGGLDMHRRGAISVLLMTRSANDAPNTSGREIYIAYHDIDAPEALHHLEREYRLTLEFDNTGFWIMPRGSSLSADPTALSPEQPQRTRITWNDLAGHFEPNTPMNRFVGIEQNLTTVLGSLSTASTATQAQFGALASPLQGTTTTWQETSANIMSRLGSLMGMDE